ncbi:type II toxin-antitoxin system RelE/ParE family toxin [Occallatibacter riparius]|uniref:Type II toxin-antitoxin system RelE/ParE family toxin n=1 Tax=Occallatibacter riparius TaxID=1002689 RepID=A0A9J7BLQ9_9BACT|nr:type II toxin-antitoxin system RelE/ParE family toxin [Occallatibacter riparius]UWZ83820.1 type II toxin-antitoxin system RelE/ParE family toxin [Occallatibacter riparius]
MNEYSLTESAKAEIREIWEYIAHDDEDAADHWVIRIIEALDLLARNPRIGHSRRDLTSRPFLFWPVGKYLIVYRPVGEDIEVIAITEGSRDVRNYLRMRS